MIRKHTMPRAGWEATVESQGLVYHSTNSSYWHESCCYLLSPTECEQIKKATADLHALCLEAVDHVIQHNDFERFGIRPDVAEFVARSWVRGDTPLYGRFDLTLSEEGVPKLLEYNADTPTSLLEASLVQRIWRDDLYPDLPQYGDIHGALATQWARIFDKDQTLHFSSVEESVEDIANCQYLRFTAQEAGFRTKFLPVERVRWDDARGVFIDAEDEAIRCWFKLYPWEWIVQDSFGTHLLRDEVRVIEPAWKMLLSNKAILPVLWELFPGHPNLLPAFDSSEKFTTTYVRKPILGREGSNISIHFSDQSQIVPGPYAKQRAIYQAYCPLPHFETHHALIGSWVIGNEPAGIGIRESAGLISEQTSRFTPHVVVDPELAEHYFGTVQASREEFGHAA